MIEEENVKKSFWSEEKGNKEEMRRRGLDFSWIKAEGTKQRFGKIWELDCFLEKVS